MKATICGVEFAEYPYERREVKAIVSLLKKPRTIIDIGANIGWWSISLSKTYPASKIYSFEPMPETIKYLRKNLAVNKVRNVRDYEVALSNKASIEIFNYYPGFPAASSFGDTQKLKAKKVKVRLLTLDLFAFADVDFIKINAEGMELFVLKGARQTIANDHPVIFCEMMRKYCAKFNYHPNDIIKFLAELNYKCYTINNEPFNKMTDDVKDTNFIFR